MAPAGSISSNVLDMANWLRFQLGEGTFAGETLIPAEIFREMHRPHTLISSDGEWGMLFPDSQLLSYGLCWFVVDMNGQRVVVHGGSIDGMNAIMALLPEADLGIVALTNVNLSNLHTLAFLREYLDEATDDSGVDWVARSLDLQRLMAEGAAAQEAELEAARMPGAKPTLPLSAYAGGYASRAYGEAEVSVEDGALILRRGPGLQARLLHWYGDTFRPEWADRAPGSGLLTFSLSGQHVLEYGEGDLGRFIRTAE
jgi:CubicO group peptidase (beta-lactamase class C family)